MSSPSKNEQDKNADIAIKAMIAATVGAAMIPAHVNWAFMATILGGGVVSIGLCYGVQLTKEEGWKLVQQFFVAAGTLFVALNWLRYRLYLRRGYLCGGILCNWASGKRIL